MLSQTLERQLEELHMELSSSQLIIKLLYKELKDITSEKTTKQPNLNQPHSTTESDTTVETTSSKAWSRVASKHHHFKNKASNFVLNNRTQPQEDVNRYAILTNLSEATDCQDENRASTNVINTKLAQDSTFNGLKKSFRGRHRHPLSAHHPRNATHQHPPVSQETHNEPTYEHEANMIPTIVNGQIITTKKDSLTNDMINKRDHIYNLAKESAVEVINNRAKYTKCSKHKVLLMGDSHMRGGAARLIASLDTCFEVCGLVKLGSTTGSLIGTAKEEVEKLTMNDFLIICSGTNDIHRNYSTKALKNITNFIKNVNHTNIILVSVPNRYDVKEYTYINSTIKSLTVSYSNSPNFSAM